MKAIKFSSVSASSTKSNSLNSEESKKSSFGLDDAKNHLVQICTKVEFDSYFGPQGIKFTDLVPKKVLIDTKNGTKEKFYFFLNGKKFASAESDFDKNKNVILVDVTKLDEDYINSIEEPSHRKMAAQACYIKFTRGDYKIISDISINDLM